MKMTYRLGILASHPIQYQAPLFRELAKHLDLSVYFAHRQSAQEQAEAGFGVAFDWDVDLLGGYRHRFLANQAKRPSVNIFFGCDTPDIATEIQQGKFDAFLVMGWYLKSFWQAIRACRKYGVPVMVRGDSQLGTPRSRLRQIAKAILYPRLLAQFDACLYVGQKNKEYLKYYGVPAERLFFSPHCVDNEFFSSLALTADRRLSRARFGIGPEQKAILFVGKLLDVKRPLDVIEALKILRGRGVDVCGVLAGDGPLRQQMEANANMWDVPVVSLGFRNQSELPVIYVAADVMALTSGSETWGLVVNEALACGTPVVVSDAVGCTPDLVIEGKTGLVYPLGDTMALADALQRVLAGPPPPAALRGRIDAYSVPAAARGILDAVEGVARKKATRRGVLA